MLPLFRSDGTRRGAGTYQEAMTRFLRPPAGRLALLGCAALLTACGRGRDAADALLGRRPASPHERYAEALRETGLADAALGRDWLAAAERALAAPLAATLPYREEGYFSPTEPAAFALRVRPHRGQRLAVRVEQTPGATPYTIFVDLFEAPPADTSSRPASGASASPAPGRMPLRLVASAASAAGAAGASGTIEHDADHDDVAYLVRLQPELLRGGRYTLTISAGPSLAFPVAGKSRTAVQSFFGADRDAGRRRHEGVDIFAARGTPVLAAAPGIVTNTGTTALGGRVVWVRDPDRAQSLYYAHLDSQIAHAGQRVRVGDTLGLVGNTGNARTTPPHLHFGVYRRGEGAIDPFPFIDTRTTEPPRLTADTSALGGLRRVAARSGATLAATPDPVGPRAALLPADAPLRVEGAVGGLYRVRLPDGREGFLAARLTSGEPRSLASALPARRASDRSVLERPESGAGVIDSVPSAEARSTQVIGRWDDYLLVRTERGRLGWLAEGARGAGRGE